MTTDESTGIRPPGLSRGWRDAIVCTALAAFAIKIILALRTYGTNDVYRWELFALGSHWLGGSVYRMAWDMNHPPSVVHFLRLIEWLTRVTGLPFPFLLRLPGILADAGSVWLAAKILGPRAAEATIRWALVMFAAAPPLILIAGFHGNTDPVLVFFLLLSVYLAEKGGVDWMAGIAFGLAVSVKVSPFIVSDWEG